MLVTGSIKRNKPYIIGVAGGSGSGKTYFARELLSKIGSQNCEIVYQDNFYIDQSHRFDFDGGSVNFDHPDSLDFDLLAKCLGELKSGIPTQIPIYDFVSHSRKDESLKMEAKKIILVDGILIFHPEHVRCLFDDLVFFETPEETRFQRRLSRDVHERGRTPEGVRSQFLNQVKPMHDSFVEPSKAHAHTVVREQDYSTVMANYCAKLNSLCV